MVYQNMVYLLLLLLCVKGINSLTMLKEVQKSCIARTDQGTVNLTSAAKTGGQSIA